MKIALLYVFFMLLQYAAVSQNGKIKVSNRDKGTYLISFRHLGYVKDTNSSMLSIRVFELDYNGVRNIEGKIKINGKKYVVYDSTSIADKDGFVDRSNIFGIDVKKGIYRLKCTAGNEYYRISPIKLNLKSLNSYLVSFYFVRKDEFKKVINN